MRSSREWWRNISFTGRSLRVHYCRAFTKPCSRTRVASFLFISLRNEPSPLRGIEDPQFNPGRLSCCDSASARRKPARTPQGTKDLQIYIGITGSALDAMHEAIIILESRRRGFDCILVLRLKRTSLFKSEIRCTECNVYLMVSL